MKKVHTFNVDEKIYKEFKMYALIINKSVSSMIEEYMKETLKKRQKYKDLEQLMADCYEFVPTERML